MVIIMISPNSCGPMRPRLSGTSPLATRKNCWIPKAESDERGRGSDPGQQGSVVGEACALNCQNGLSIGSAFFSVVGHRRGPCL